MRQLVLAVCAIGIAAVGAGATADRALAGSLCVGSGAHCFATIQAAVDAANDGDVIHVGPGAFAGGITIDKNLKLIGAGAGATIISGGGPVLTIGEADAPSEPTVAIKGVTITGGVNSAAPAYGGGIFVPASATGGGATVTISDSLVTGNRAAPAAAGPGCDGLPAATGSGGGIDNAGAMTLSNVVVSNNEAGSNVSSDADGGGIMNEGQAALILRNSVVNGNVARVTTPNGRFGEGGGVFTRRGSTLTIDASVVHGNTVDYSTSVPDDDPCGGFAQAGGIKIGGDETTTVSIRNTTIDGNSVLASSSNGDLVASAGGIDDDGSLVVRDSTISGNRVSGTSGASAFLDAGGLEIEGAATITNTRFTGNNLAATAAAGMALSQGGAIVAVTPELVTISDSIVRGNSASSTTATGSAVVQGGGIQNGGLLELRGTTVSDNTGTASGPSGVAQGGGIWNSTLLDEVPIGQLILRNSAITDNALNGSPGITLQGGGLFTTFPVTLKDSLIATNTPDQCYGC
jgi:hypothetical protein